MPHMRRNIFRQQIKQQTKIAAFCPYHVLFSFVTAKACFVGWYFASPLNANYSSYLSSANLLILLRRKQILKNISHLNWQHCARWWPSIVLEHLLTQQTTESGSCICRPVISWNYHIEAETKCRQHFQLHFLTCKLFQSYQKFTDIFTNCPNINDPTLVLIMAEQVTSHYSHITVTL